MSTKLVTLMSLGALALAPALIASGADAQAPAVTPGYTGSAASSVPGCPRLMWRLARNGADVNGVTYYSDMSGLSQVKGTVDPSGHFTLTLTSVMGNGPVATVTGQRGPVPHGAAAGAQGALVADIKGEGCANAHISMRPVLNLNQFGVGG